MTINKKSLSYKSSDGFKIFGVEWELLFEKCLYLETLRYNEKQLVRRLVHVGHRLSQPVTTSHDDYNLIMKDLQDRLQSHLVIQNEVETEIAIDFEALCKQKKIIFS